MSESERGRELLTVREAADQLKVCEETIYRLVSRGQLAAVRVGRLLRISHGDIQSYLHRSET